MTSIFLRPAIGMAIALCLASCGGKASFTINGTVENLAYKGLVLSTNGMRLPVDPSGNVYTSFSFPNSLSYGDVYNVEIANKVADQPLHQTCVVTSFVDNNSRIFTGPTDTAGRLAKIDVGVRCALNSFSIGGKITGKSEGLVLINGSSDTLGPFAADIAAYTFGLAVPYGASYGVSVLTQPKDTVCRVSPNGTGVMGDAAVGNIDVTCVPATP